MSVKVISPKPATILSADGQVISELGAGDRITIRRARRTVRLMHLAGSSFCETLRCKLHWRGAILMIRLKDIAQRAGLSIMTVSKALRDAPDVSAATKTRIKLLAQQMGYVPDSTARGLRTRKTKLFGLVISSMTNPVYSRVVLAIEEGAYALGYDVLLAHTLNLPEREEACLRRLLSRRVDGLFISPVYRMAAEARIYQELLARRIPTVLLGHTAPFCSQFVNVETDDLLASYAVTQHLLKLGHKRIAFLAGPLATPWTQGTPRRLPAGLA